MQKSYRWADETLCYQTFTYLMTLFTMVRWSLVPPWWLEMVRVTRTRVHGEVLVSMGHGRGCGGLSGEAARTSDVILTSTVSTPPHSHQPDIQLTAVVLTAAIHTARYLVFPTPMISDQWFYAISDLISIVEFLFIVYLRHWVSIPSNIQVHPAKVMEILMLISYENDSSIHPSN